MIRHGRLAAAIVGASLLSFATSASAMTWSKPVHFTVAGISPRTPFPPTAISCPSTRLCAVTVSPIPVGGYRGPSWIATTRDPGARHPVWRATQVRPAQPLLQITCTRSGVCATYDLQFFYFSADAAAARPRWRQLSVPSGFTSLSCPTARLCVASGDRGGVVAVSTNPAGRRPSWRKLRISTATARCPGSDCAAAIRVTVVATCPTSSSCTAIDDAGNRFTTTKPTGPADAWRVVGRYHRTPAAPGTFPDLYLDCVGAFCPGIDCPSSAFCAGVSGQNFFTAADPQAAWRIGRLPAAQVLPVPDGSPSMLSCASKVFCAVLDWGGDVSTSHDPLSASPRWSTHHLQFEEEHEASMACPSASLCVAVAPGAKPSGQQISIGRG
jgi:hypothetical protein